MVQRVGELYGDIRLCFGKFIAQPHSSASAAQVAHWSAVLKELERVRGQLCILARLLEVVLGVSLALESQHGSISLLLPLASSLEHQMRVLPVCF